MAAWQPLPAQPPGCSKLRSQVGPNYAPRPAPSRPAAPCAAPHLLVLLLLPRVALGLSPRRALLVVLLHALAAAAPLLGRLAAAAAPGGGQPVEGGHLAGPGAPRLLRQTRGAQDRRQRQLLELLGGLTGLAMIPCRCGLVAGRLSGPCPLALLHAQTARVRLPLWGRGVVLGVMAHVVMAQAGALVQANRAVTSAGGAPALAPRN